MIASAEPISCLVMNRYCVDLKEWASHHGYPKNCYLKGLRADPAITWWKGDYGGHPCMYLVWKHIRYIWRPVDDFYRILGVSVPLTWGVITEEDVRYSVFAAKKYASDERRRKHPLGVENVIPRRAEAM